MTSETYAIDEVKTTALKNMGTEARLILRGSWGEELYVPVTLRQLENGKVEMTTLGGGTETIDPTDSRISYGSTGNERCGIH